MSSTRFFRYELRTTDLAAASRFYADVLGFELRAGAVGTLELAQLPERAIANGARPHWLGHVAVGDVDAHLAKLTASGAQQLGPMQQRADGARHAIVRHPIGAMLALSSAALLPPEPRVAWHQLATTERESAFALYSDLFGWTARDIITLPDDFGANVDFAWDASGPAVGGIAESARKPGIHVQWLFHFSVTDLDATIEKVRSLGGLALTPMTLADGRRVSACDDPRGGAFGLLQMR